MLAAKHEYNLHVIISVSDFIIQRATKDFFFFHEFEYKTLVFLTGT